MTQAASVAYPRRGTGHDAEQLKGYATFSDLTLLNTTADSAAFYRLGAPYQIKHYELTLTSSQFSSRLSKAALLTAIGQATEVDYSVTNATGTKKRLLSSQEVMYWNEDASTNLSNSQVASHALPYRVLNQVMTPTMRDAAFNNDGTTRVTESMITGEGLYVKRHGNYWVPNDLLIFDSGNFFRVNQVNHYTGGSTILTYDAYSMMPVSIQDAVNNVSSATCDYRLLQPWETTDLNGNRQQVAFDTLGMVVKTAVMGKAPDHPNFLQDEGDTLSDPTVRMTYDLYQWMNHQAPNFAKMEARETHGGSPVWQTAYTYTNGMGDVALEKVQAEPGDAFQRDGNGDLVLDGNGDPIKAHTATRWIGNGRTVINNKGAAVKQYEPYFSSTHEYEDETEVREYGVTPILTYDPMGRNVRTDMPDGNITKVAFDAWQQKSYDPVDTVMDVDDQGNWESTWYTDRNAPDPAGPEPSDPDELAAWLSAQHYNTPKIVHLDSLGRSYLTQDDNGTNGNPDFIEVRVELDIEGKQLSVTNDQGQQTDFRYSMRPISQDGSADILYTDSSDGGWRRALTNISGNPIRAWNERGFAFRNEFDQLLRPTHAWVDEGSGELLAQYTLYGDANGVSGAEAYNLRGQVVRAADTSGLSRSIRFDFKANMLEAETELATDYQNTVDWSVLNGITNQFSLDTAAGPLLENIPGTTPFSTTMAYDALNRPTLITQPDGSEHQPGYNEANLLETMDVRLYHEGNFTTYVENIDYDEKGQRTAIVYGNGSTTTYQYDPNSFRLTRLLTTRNSGNDILQDLQYTYDAIGNITQLKDDAQQTHFFNNTIIAPVGKYRYDALYRLTQANGREKASLPMPGNGGYGAPSPIPTGGTAPDTFGNYRETYNYDSLGNILSIGHQDTTVGGTNHWTRYFDYGAAQPHTNLPNNLLQSTHSGTAPSSPDFTYDAHGNMLQMPHLSSMQWDFADQLRATTRGNETTWYVYSGGERTRKVMEDPNGKRYERIYLGGYELYREYDLGGGLQKQRDTHKVMDDQRMIALLEVQTADADGTIDPPDRTTITRYQYTNHLDSASMELDENAGLISYEEYYPFGSTSYQLHTNDSEVSLKRYKYVHKELDEETGLYYYGARYHAPWLCRFVSVDPLKDKFPYYSTYQYAGNKPIISIDIDGLESPVNIGQQDQKVILESDNTRVVSPPPIL
ncbi:MAG: RHS repeat-associated core domain-containing protein, partial [Bacteroidota bacterium]